MRLALFSGMLKKLKRKIIRRKITKLIKDHATEILLGALVGFMTDVIADVARHHFDRSIGHRLKRAM